jgi:hypothetical protein
MRPRAYHWVNRVLRAPAYQQGERQQKKMEKNQLFHYEYPRNHFTLTLVCKNANSATRYQK